MGWFLWRVPYPGLAEEEKIDILTDVLLVGRGRECSVHCLSMYVSRRHLQIIPKDDGCVYVTDLGSSNGTFVNQNKITPDVEFPLNVGDEVGIGNVNNDNKDCFIYEVRRIVKEQCSPNQDKVKEEGRQSPALRHTLERGLKRCASDPEIVTLDDDDDAGAAGDAGDKVCEGIMVESLSVSSKRPKLDDTGESSSGPDTNNHVESEANFQCPESPPNVKDLKSNCFSAIREDEVPIPCGNNATAGIDSPAMKNGQFIESAGEGGSNVPNVKAEQISGKQCSPLGVGSETLFEFIPPQPQPVPISANRRSSVEANSFQKPMNHQVSALLEGSCDTSSGTVKISSPASGSRIFPRSSFSTPNHSKYNNPNDVIPALTSTPFVKAEDHGALACPNNADWSPITKDASSRHSQGSGNYTLDEEMIPIDLCDEEDDEVFPCSQMFAEEDVKPCIEEIEADVVDLSVDEEPQTNKMERDDDIILISSSDEDDDCMEDANRWFMRLSQSFVKEEPIDHDKSDCSLIEQPGENEDGLWEDHGKAWDDDLQELQELEKPHVSGEASDALQKDEPSKKMLKNAEEAERKAEQQLDDEEPEIIGQMKAAPEKELNDIPGGMPEKTLAGTSKDTKHKDKKDTSKRKNYKKDRDRSGRSKDRATEPSSRKAETKRHKQSSSDKETSAQSDKHLSHHSKYVSSKDSSGKGNKIVERLRNIFSDSDSDDEEVTSARMDKHLSHHSKYVSSKDSNGKDNKIVERLRNTFSDSDSDVEEPIQIPPSKSDIEFDKLLMEPSRASNVKLVENHAQVALDRLENDPQLCERYGLSPGTSQPPAPPQNRKRERKIELIDAPPQPHRRAFNRGISAETAQKMYAGERRKSIDEPKARRSKDTVDTNALRKEKLAKVAAKNSKNKERSESKRAAPAKVKITASNRGSFLTESDEPSPYNKPSRKDIVTRMKIPKLKEKPVVSHLPTKSPLQAMNMSWEKKSPPLSVGQPSNAKTGPVEIPTGPQPKKRIAQVPPPGFEEESRLFPIPVPSAPFKSCLLGSSKHNIAINSSKPVAPKKHVRFKENIVEVRIIERLPNTKPVKSYRDADRPKAMSQITPVKLPKGPVVPNNETILQDVVYDISKWNPLWLKEEKDLPPDVAPPVVSNMVLPHLPKTEFLDFREYHETMYPLLMLELWNGVSKEYNSRANDARNTMIMAVDTACSSAVHLKPDRMLTTLSCHMVADNRSHIDFPRLGTLVIIDLALKDASGKFIINPVFGYVSFDCQDRLRNTDQFHKDLLPHCANPTSKIRFSVMIRERKNFTYALERVMRIKQVKYIRGDLRMFQAMKNLEYTPLHYSVISPMAASEDFTLPDVSQKTLACSEQLNPTQEKIVLQTAEVGLQEKPKICLIQGPPGTGKTQAIESLVMHMLYRDGMYSRSNRERGLIPRILLCAPSNNAIDLLVARLLRRRAKLEKERRFKMVRVGQPQQEDVKGVSLTELANVAMKQERAANGSHGIEMQKELYAAKLCAVENQIRDLNMNKKPIPQVLEVRKADYIRKIKVLDERQKQQNQASSNSSKQDFAIEREAKKRILRGADIIATTLNSCVIKVMETVFPPTSSGKHHFHVCIVDEATQCLEVETLIPLLLGVKTLVLVGDPNQLPATILSKIAREKGLGTSLFARLQNVVPKAVQLLDTQYRMHPEILRWPNKFFYNRRLKSPDQMLSRRESRILPYTILSLPFHQDPRGEVNHDEARLVLELAEVIAYEKVIQHDFRIGIITPYQSQRRAFESMMERMPKQMKSMFEVNTIDSFQGQEKDIIILSCVRTNGVGFLSDRQRVNVALTRAKYALFICGNFSSLDRDAMWNNLLADARQRKCLIEIRNHPQNKSDLWNLICRQPK